MMRSICRIRYLVTQEFTEPCPLADKVLRQIGNRKLLISRTVCHLLMAHDLFGTPVRSSNGGNSPVSWCLLIPGSR
jgi:hypothetical protein